MVRLIVFFLLFFVNVNYSMDEAVDVFTQQPVFVKKLCIFPLLQLNDTIDEDRTVLFSLLVNKRLVEQMECPFFIRDVVNFLASKYRESDEVVVDALNIPKTARYAKECQEMYQLTTKRTTKYNACPRIASLVSRGAWLNAHYGKDGISILMKVLPDAQVAFFSFLVKQGACVNARDFCDRTVLAHAISHKRMDCVEILLANGTYPDECNENGENFLMDFVSKNRKSYVSLFLQYGANPNARTLDGYVRDYNIMYQKEIKKIIRPLLGLMWSLESHNRNFPKKYKDVAHELCAMPEAKKLKKALSIDALLEHYGAQLLVKDEWHPLLKLIKGSAIMCRLFQYLYRHDYKQGTAQFILPKNVEKCLCKA